MTYQAAIQKIEQAAAEQWEELDLAGMREWGDALVSSDLRA
jgi:hypothetical protein